jgi:SagB-type dehydrogenase family enzyme
VEGVREGAYYYDRREEALRLLKAGSFRSMAGYLCLEQALAADASCVVFLMVELDRVLEELGDRGYRAAQLEAGVVAGKLYLAAYSLGLGATGLTFYDDDVAAFFKPDTDTLANMLTVAVGIPAYKARMGRIYTGVVQHPKGGPSRP